MTVVRLGTTIEVVDQLKDKKLLKEKWIVLLILPLSLVLGLSFYLFYLKKQIEVGLWGSDSASGSALSLIYLYDIINLLIVILLTLVSLKMLFQVSGKVKNEEKLKRELENKGEALSFASHELYSPITNIRNTLSVVLPEVPSSYQKFVERALLSTDRLVKLIDTLLAISRMEMGKIKLERQPNQIEKVCEEVISEFRPEAEKNSLTLNFEHPSEPLPPISFDLGRIREVLINFVGNAIKYTSAGSVTLKTFLKDNDLVVGVADTGMGLAQTELSNLFNRFYRSDSAEEHKHGSGLGLYISRLIIEAHHGKIWAESEAGKGSRFFFSLPAYTKARS